MDNSLEHIAKCKSLKELNIENTFITKTGVKKFAKDNPRVLMIGKPFEPTSAAQLKMIERMIELGVKPQNRYGDLVFAIFPNSWRGTQTELKELFPIAPEPEIRALESLMANGAIIASFEKSNRLEVSVGSDIWTGEKSELNDFLQLKSFAKLGLLTDQFPLDEETITALLVMDNIDLILIGGNAVSQSQIDRLRTKFKVVTSRESKEMRRGINPRRL